MSPNDFEQQITNAAEKIRQAKDILLVAHLDCDGVSAAAIMAKIARELDIPHDVMRIRELNQAIYASIAKKSQQLIIFLDAGSSVIKDIVQFIKQKDILIIDHHQAATEHIAEQRITEVNPKSCGITERRTISSSGIAYLLAEQLIPGNELEPIALLGAIGDAHEDLGFIGINQDILKKATDKGLMETKKNIRLFGRETRPIHKTIEYSVDIPMKRLTNNKENVKELLRKLDIPLRRKGEWVTMNTLSPDEESRLTDSLLNEMSEEIKQKAFWFSYTLLKRPKGSPTRDLREFSTLMNACGRLDDITLGIDICLGDEHAVKNAQNKLREYKQEISKAKRFIDRHPESMIKQRDLVIIKGDDQIPADLAGTITSIYTRMGKFSKDTVVCTLADAKDNKVKISMRTLNQNYNLREILNKVTKQLGGESGGHKNAAGGIIKKEDESKFIELLSALVPT